MEDFNRGDDDKVEEHIKALTEKAKQLINRQMGQVQEEGGKRGKLIKTLVMLTDIDCREEARSWRNLWCGKCNGSWLNKHLRGCH